MPDPLDKQLVEAVLTRPRRAKADVEEAKLATRGLRAAKVVLPKVEDDEDEDDVELAPPEGLTEAEGDVGVEVVGADGEAVDSKLRSTRQRSSTRPRSRSRRPRTSRRSAPT
jgi:hypothetical protein